jgi:hypothetical protein
MLLTGKVDENLIRVNLSWMQRNITIIGVYTPSKDKDVNTKD